MNQEKLYTNLLSLLLLCIGFNQTLSADTNCLLTLDIEDHAIAATGDEICLSVTTQNFTDIIGMQFNIEFNEDELEFVGITPGAIPIDESGYNNYAPGEIIVGYVSPNINNSFTLADGAVAFDLCFNVTATSGTISPVSFLFVNAVEFISINLGNLPSTLLSGSVQVDGAAPASPLLVTEECGTGCTGLDIIVDGGQAPYSYQWTGPNGYNSTDEDLSGVGSGTYSLIVTDNTGATISSSFTVDELAGLSLSSVITSVDCSGGDIGAIDLTVNNGTAPFTYTWSNGANTEDLINLAEGTYSVTVEDDGGCSAVGSFEVASTGLTAALSYECITSDETGTVTALIFNPQESYSFAWSNGETNTDDETSEITDLPSGTYSVTITGLTSGCTQTLNITFDCTAGTVSDCFSLEIANHYPEAGEQVCVPIKTNGFDDIEGIQFSLGWDEAILSYANTQAYGLDGMTVNSFGENLTNEGKLSFLWFNGNPANGGATLYDGSTLFEVCFDVLGVTGTGTELNITNDPVAIEVLTSGPPVKEIEFSAANGEVHVGTNTDSLLVHDICALGDLCNAEVLLTASASGGPGPYTYNWLDEDGNTIATTAELTVSVEGYYELIVTDADGNTASAFTSVIDEDCVWPGDTDDDGVVSNFDLLNIGLGAGTNGSVRPNASIAWLGQAAPNWFQSTPVTDVNYKHIDTDGNGAINASDTTAIIQNWGEVHSFTGGGTENEFISGDNPDTDGGPSHFLTVPFYVQSDTLEPNVEVALPVILGDVDNEVTDLYGIAFTITYDPEVIVANSARVSFEDSWLGDINDNAIAIQKNFHPEGRLDIAMTRMDGNNMDGFGKLADFHITIEDDIFLKGGGDENRGVLTTDTDFGIENVRMITNQEVELLAIPMTTTSVIETITTGNKDWDGAKAIRLFPNPVTDNLTIQSPEAMIQTVEIYDLVGALLQINTFSPNNSAALNTNHLSEGTYYVKIQTDKGQTTRRIVVLRK